MCICHTHRMRAVRSLRSPLLLKVTVAGAGRGQNGGGMGELASLGLAWARFPVHGGLALGIEQAPVADSVKVPETQLRACGQTIQAQALPSLRYEGSCLCLGPPADR